MQFNSPPILRMPPDFVGSLFRLYKIKHLFNVFIISLNHFTLVYIIYTITLFLLPSTNTTMVSTLQTLTSTIVMVSLFLGCAERASGMRFVPNSSMPPESKHSDFLVNMAPQPSGLFPGFGRFLLPPKPKMPFLPYKDPLAAAPVTSYAISPSPFTQNPGYEARSPNSGEDQVPPVPQP